MTNNSKPPETTTQHGVFLDVLGLGVLLSGVSGIGKSELALGLINRGHRLVADDCVELSHNKQHGLTGRCSAILQDFLEVRGIGILNVRAMFGDTSIKESKHLQLIVNLLHISKEEMHCIDRLLGMHRTRTIMDVDIPEVSIPVAPGRTLSVLIEAAVRNQQLKLSGYDASIEFKKRHESFIKENNQ